MQEQRTRELADLQHALADAQQRMATCTRELDSVQGRAASLDQQVPQLQQSLAARDKRVAALEEKLGATTVNSDPENWFSFIKIVSACFGSNDSRIRLHSAGEGQHVNCHSGAGGG